MTPRLLAGIAASALIALTANDTAPWGTGSARAQPQAQRDREDQPPGRDRQREPARPGAQQPSQQPQQGRPAQPGQAQQPQRPGQAQQPQRPSQAQQPQPPGQTQQPQQPGARPARPGQPPAAATQPPREPAAQPATRPGQARPEPRDDRRRDGIDQRRPAPSAQPAQQPPQPGIRPAQPPAAQAPAAPRRPDDQPRQPPAQAISPRPGPSQPDQQTAPAAPQRQVQPPGRTPAPQITPSQPAQVAPASPSPSAADQRPRRLDDFRSQRREEQQGGRVVIHEPGRTIIREGGRTVIRYNEADRFRYGARDVRTERRGNENVTIIERPDGTRIITITDDSGRLVRRVRRDRSGRELVIIDNSFRPRGPAGYFIDVPPPVVRIPRDRYIVEADRADRALIYEALMAPPVMALERRYSLDEVRYNVNLRERMPRVDIDTITFDTGSWEVTPDQAARLEVIADAILRAIRRNPTEVFLIEGHTDAVGSDIDNLSLSDRRAEAVAVILTEQFGVPAENLTTQGYGEQHLKVPTDGPERRNRRVTVRRITPLLAGRDGPQRR